MKVRQLMSRDPRTCTPTTSVAEAASLLWRHDCGVLPVVDHGGRAVGVVTDRDLLIALGTRDRPASQVAVSEVLSGHLYAVGPDDEVERAIDVMRQHQVRRVMVTDDKNRVVGVLSLNDLALRADGREAPTATTILETLKAISVHRHVALA
jgi:CBS domain-containing protein